MEKIEGKHDYDGACAPSSKDPIRQGQETFSLGVFQWERKSRGNGLKRGKVKVRVCGPVSSRALVESVAREIAVALDAGTYDGPKTVDVARKGRSAPC